MNDFDNNKEFDEKIDPKEVLDVLWLNKKFIITFTAIAALISVLYSLSLTNIYTAQTLLSPTASLEAESSSSQFSGLANMAGINIPKSGGENQLAVALELIKSKKLLDRLSMYESFLPDLVAAESWDMQTNTITYNQSLYDTKNKVWVRKASLPFKQIPSSQEVLGKFLGHVSISKKAQLIILKVDHLSPAVAYQWSLWIVKEVNAILADMEISNSKASIDYLNNQIKTTPYSELRTMFAKLIQESTQSMMLASVNPEYVLTTIDPPVIPEIKSHPKRSSICILGTLLGGMLSVLIILIRKFGFGKDDELNIFKLS